MPFDPTLPVNNAKVRATELRDQFNGLNDLIQAKPSSGEVANAVSLGVQGTSNNSNGVGAMSLSVDTSYNQAQMQQIADKLDELILALRR